jgi:hypothetical protein
VQYGWECYVQWERDCVTAWLADLETRLIEERLPVPQQVPTEDERVTASTAGGTGPDVRGGGA